MRKVLNPPALCQGSEDFGCDRMVRSRHQPGLNFLETGERVYVDHRYGLCKRCYTRARAEDKLGLFVPTPIPDEEFAEEIREFMLPFRTVEQIAEAYNLSLERVAFKLRRAGDRENAKLFEKAHHAARRAREAARKCEKKGA